MHPVKMMMESKLEVHKDKTLREATEMAYKVCWFIVPSPYNFPTIQQISYGKLWKMDELLSR